MTFLLFKFKVNQLHLMLNKAEHTTQNIIMKYDTEVQKLTKQVILFFFIKIYINTLFI